MSKYSIVIITSNGKKKVKRCIETLKKYKVFDSAEVIIVDATDDEGSLGIQQEKIKYIKVPLKEKGFSHQRNIGVVNSLTDYIIFIDDDIEITENWFKTLTEEFEKNKDKYFGAMGAVFPKNGNSNFISFSIGVLGHPGGGFRLHNYSRGKMIELSQVATCNTIFRKDIILDVGMFNLANKFGSEDTDICLRITKKYGKNKFVYIPDAIVWHDTHKNLFKVVKWYIRRGMADIDLVFVSSVHFEYVIKTSFILKLFTVFLISLFFKPLIFIFLILWYFTQLMKHKFMWKYFHIYNFSIPYRMLTFLCFPFIKLIADVAFDLGRLVRIFLYLIYRT
ncbi:MAG: glycosyltransferase [Endomicrobia bacterium]|nr:glycosyltransferase [Endomicrobiia bacterium]MDW8055315.1 glycosyltransferase [Elusimicrobiota bacterium]